MKTKTVPTPEVVTEDRDHLLDMLRMMILIRRYEEKCSELYQASKIRGFMHLYIGEEAVAVGVMQALTPEDNIVATYREHGQALARGVDGGEMMAEMYGKLEGCCRGRGGSMHIFDAKNRFYGGNAIVAGGIPLAVGFALADKMQNKPTVSCCFFGEGATPEGEFHESLNMAALWHLPVLFVCENNLWCMGTSIKYHSSSPDIYLKPRTYGIPSERVDGMDVLAVEAAARKAVEHIRAGNGPYFLEIMTYRYRPHSMFDADTYRDKNEVEEWKKKDAILRLSDHMGQKGWLSDQELDAIEKEVAAEVQRAVDFAEAGTWESVEDLNALHLLREEAGMNAVMENVKMTYREGSKQAIREALNRDPRVFLMGADVGAYGGCFAVTKGLLAEYGPERIRDCPLCESTYTGIGLGAAMGGMRPIVEVMTVNFSLLALDQIMNNAATLLHMTGGMFNVPVVIRMATGAGRQLAAQHAHSLEGWYAHIPGIKVVAPGTVEDVRGMLWPALEDPDPVIIFEHQILYNMEEMVALPVAVDIDHAVVRRPGRDVTILTYGASLHKAMEAAGKLAEEGIEAEVIDLRTLRPLDNETILNSVGRTHRALVVDEGWRSVGISAEISARITENIFYELDAPVGRLCGAEVPMPYSRHMEQAALPQAAAIVEQVKGMVH